MSYAAKLNRNRSRASGALLREDVIPATGRSKTEIAAMLGISRQPSTSCASASRCRRSRRSPGQAVRRRRLDRMLAAYNTWQAERQW